MKVSLVKGYGAVHRSECYAVKNARGVHGVAPEIEESEVPAFLKARNFYPCLACFPELRA